MEKFWTLYAKNYGGISDRSFKSYEEAEAAAKRAATNKNYQNYEIVIMQSVAFAKAPVPDIEIATIQ